MTVELLQIELLSPATFSANGRLSGDVDIEVVLDHFGLPEIGGKTVHGLLGECWWDMEPAFPELRHASTAIFGPVADRAETAILEIQDAQLEDSTRDWLRAAVSTGKLKRHEVVDAFCETVGQTAIDRDSGTPATGSLRTSRVVSRGLVLQSTLRWAREPSHDELRCLALAVLALRHGGSTRTRGRGHLRCWLGTDTSDTGVLAKAQVHA